MFRPTLVLSSFVLFAASAVPAAAQCDAYVLQPTLHPTGPDPRGVAFGRIDADAHVDMVVPRYASEDVAVLFGDALGGFGAPVAFAAGSHPRAAAVGDLDGDGDLDVAVCNEGFLGGTGWQAFGFTVLWNAGGSFTSSTFVALPAGEILPSDLALGDFDGDTDLDVALTVKGTGMNHSKLASFVNQGGGTFGAANLASSGYDPVALALGDINGDKLLDAVTVNNYAGTVTILNGTGSGTFTLVFGHSVGTYPGDLTLGDFDGDADLDCAVAYRYGVNVLDNVAGIFNWTASLSAGIYPNSVSSADFDGDGDLDLASTDGISDTLYLFDGSGAGSFALRTSFVVGDNPAWLAAYDVDQDGALDLGVVAYNADGVVILDNECPLSTYCVGKVNSKGCTPAIGSTGTPSLSGPDDFHLTATQELSQKSGLLFVGVQAAALPFAGGTLCVKPPLKRTVVQNSGGTVGQTDCTGTYDYHLTNARLVSKGWSAGMDAFTQYWGRDPQHPDGSTVSLSDALRFELQP